MRRKSQDRSYTDDLHGGTSYWSKRMVYNYQAQHRLDFLKRNSLSNDLADTTQEAGAVIMHYPSSGYKCLVIKVKQIRHSDMSGISLSS